MKINTVSRFIVAVRFQGFEFAHIYNKDDRGFHWCPHSLWQTTSTPPRNPRRVFVTCLHVDIYRFTCRTHIKRHFALTPTPYNCFVIGDWLVLDWFLMHRANILKNPQAAYYGARFAINPFVEGDQMRARPSLLVVLIMPKLKKIFIRFISRELGIRSSEFGASC